MAMAPLGRRTAAAESYSRDGCTSLADLFRFRAPEGSSGLYERNLNDFVLTPARGEGARNGTAAATAGEGGGETYTYSTPGDQDLWGANPLSRDMGEGADVVGFSSGVCNLLPPDGTASQCLAVFTFQQEQGSPPDTLVLSSAWSNDATTPGEMIIVGGTGCYENVEGTISAIATDDTWAYFHYQLVEDNGFVEIDGRLVSETCPITLYDMFGHTEPPTLYEMLNDQNKIALWSGSTPTVADRNLWSGNTLKQQGGDDVGTASGVCTRISDGTCFGTETFQFQYGNVTSTVISNNNSIIPFKIIGGSGCFHGEKGTMTVSYIPETKGPEAYKFILNPDVEVDCNGISLEELLVGGILEMRNNVTAISPNGTKGSAVRATGDKLLWSNNTLLAGGTNVKIGRSLGICTLLPPMGAEYLCSVELDFDEGAPGVGGGGAVSFMGLLPDKVGASGPMAVVSGTGCFQNLTGKSLNYTANSFGDNGGYFTVSSYPSNQPSTASFPSPPPSTALAPSSSGSSRFSDSTLRQPALLIPFLMLISGIVHK
ncbi:hypothetical protein ACHAWF_004543 [Thalassiosira exigua]